MGLWHTTLKIPPENIWKNLRASCCDPAKWPLFSRLTNYCKLSNQTGQHKDGICPHVIKKLSEYQETYSSLLFFFKFYIQYPFMAGPWTVCLCRHSLWWPQSELSPSERALEARTILWPPVPSVRMNYSIQQGRIFFIHWFSQPSNNLDCLSHSIFHFRRRNCPHKGTPIVHLTNFAFDLSLASQGEKPDFSSSMPLNHLNPCQKHYSHKEKSVIWYRAQAWLLSHIRL